MLDDRSATQHVPYPRAQRSRSCHCCRRTLVRTLVRVGTPTDPDYAVAVCPGCDLAAPLPTAVPA